MKRLFALFVSLALVCTAEAGWLWPFSSSSSDDDYPRLSDMMEPVTDLVDEGSDLAEDGKVNEAVAKYREALKQLDRIEAANPERVKKPEFATIRTKRAYIGAAIDSLLLSQARDNARAVAVSDTHELEERLAKERGISMPATTNAVRKVENAVSREKKVRRENAEPDRPLTKREQAMKAISEKRFKEASELIKELLTEKPKNAVALNLRAAMESEQGDLKAAERTLDEAIVSNPRNYFAYYNMAELRLKAGDKSGARRYYETGREYGGPEDKQLEELFK